MFPLRTIKWAERARNAEGGVGVTRVGGFSDERESTLDKTQQSVRHVRRLLF